MCSDSAAHCIYAHATNTFWVLGLHVPWGSGRAGEAISQCQPHTVVMQERRKQAGTDHDRSTPTTAPVSAGTKIRRAAALRRLSV